MLPSFPPMAAAGPLLGIFCVALILGVGLLHRRLRRQNRRVADALDNMSQGLCMFDGQGRIAVRNLRYVEMYKLDPEIVRPGLSLRGLIQHRKDTGLFTGDVDAYCQMILDGVRAGKSNNFYVEASDGRVVFGKNDPLPDGGWVSTHEDATEQRRAAEERAAIRDMEQRRYGDRRLPAAGGSAAGNRRRQRRHHARDRRHTVRRLRPHQPACERRGRRLQ
jgi:methyl-accepting chemotaxis protein